MMKLRNALLAALAATGLFGMAGGAMAASSFVTGTGALSASAAVDFQITVPKILFLRVGTGSLYANDATVNLISFTVPTTGVGNGTAVAASGTSGDLGNGVVTAVVRGNGGNVTFGVTTTGALSDGGSPAVTIDWNQISTTAAANTTATTLAAPTLTTGATTNITLTAVNKVVNQDAKWTYSYLNQNVVAAGTYGGVNTNGGRVTYTAALP